MHFKSILSFLKNPRRFLEKRMIKRSEALLSESLKDEFFIPINSTREDDVFIVGFPKSGNTWLQTLIAGVQFGIDSNYLSDQLAQEIVPDVHARKYYKRFGKINFFKTHHLPQPHYKRVIYLVRDGRDALVSYYHFNKKLGLRVSLGEMIFENKALFPSTWHDHVKEWNNNPYHAEILIIRYEDLLQDAFKELRKICDFSKLERDDETLKRIIEGSSIEKMRGRVKFYNGMAHKNWEGEKGADFFRKGQAGDFKNEMTIEEQLHFNTVSKNELLLFGYEI